MSDDKALTFERDVSILLQTIYGITWQEASGDWQELQRGMAEALEPAEFVTQFGERYDLVPIAERWF